MARGCNVGYKYFVVSDMTDIYIKKEGDSLYVLMLSEGHLRSLPYRHIFSQRLQCGNVIN